MKKLCKPNYLFLFFVLMISNNYLYANKNKPRNFFQTQKVTVNSLPTIVTMPIIQIGLDSAICGGNIISNGGETITASGICLSKHPIPTLSDIVIPNGATSGEFVSMIKKLYPETAYYVRAYATNASGTAYGVQRTFATDPYKIGSKIHGGTLFYVFKPGDMDYIEGEFHGLVFGNASNPINWNNLIDSLTGAIDTVIGTGNINTDKIVNTIGAGSYAASYSGNSTHNGFSDWYLPNVKELELLSSQALGNYVSPCGNCWTSNEISKTHAIGFVARKRNNALKTTKYKAVAIRKF